MRLTVRAPDRFSVVALIFALALPGAATAQDFGGLTLGVALDKLGDELDQAVKDAGNQAQATEIEAGRDTSIAIAEAKNAYAASLNKTVKTLDPKIRQSLDQIKDMTNGVVNNTFASIDVVQAKLQEVTNSLPLRSNEPQVTSLTPRFVVPSRAGYPARVSFHGNFINSSESGMTPSLVVNHKTHFASTSTTQELDFLVPVNELFTVGAGKPTGFSATRVSLEVPWAQSQLLGLYHKKRTDNFYLLIGALPPTPGDLTLIHTVTGTNHVVKTFTSQNFHICSTGECGNNDDKDHHFSVHPDAGWHVVRGSSQPGVGSAQGDHSGPNFVSDDGDVVVYAATTIHHGIGSSGSIDFNLKFQEYQDQPTSTHVPEKVQLYWGDSHLIPYDAGTWKLTADTFDGSHLEFAGVDSTQKFIKITSSGGMDEIKTSDPASLIWP